MTKHEFIRAYILIRVHPQGAESVIHSLARARFCRMVDPVYGPYDVIAVVEAPNSQDLSRIVLHDIRALPGVAETITCLALSGGNGV